jgi:hypothetical protein
VSDAFYADAKDDADELIAEFGMDATLIRPTVAAGTRYDPTPGADTERPVKVVVLDFNVAEINGNTILVTDKKILMAKGNLDLEPALSDKIRISGTVYSLVEPIKPFAPAGTVVFWQLQARK